MLPSRCSSRCLLLGSLNCLGEGYNPVEFMASDADFLKSYNVMENKATSMTWLEMETLCQAVTSRLRSPHLKEALNKLKVHCKNNVVGEVWSFFTEEVLKNDNKLLENRLNMLILGMQRSPDSSKLQWQLNDSSWCNEMVKLDEHEGANKTYKKDPNLFVWDLACNAVASSCVDQYNKICEASHLNPANFSKMAEGFFRAVLDAAKVFGGRIEANRKVEHKSQQMPVLLGLQEWPRRDTERGDAFRRVLREKGFEIADASSVALAYSDPDRKLGEPTVVVNGEVGEEFAQDLLTQMGCSRQAEGTDDEALKAMLATTRQKVLAVKFEKVDLAVVVVHAKEPKTAIATAVLAEFICQIAAKFGSKAKWVAMTDTNIATQENASVFADELYSRDLVQVPMLTESTTAKRRSLLHGQCYDAKKSLKLVTAPKDKIISTPGSLRSARIFPDLSDSKVLLPSPTWATDHALVTTVLDLNMLVPNSNEIRKCSRACLTGAPPASRLLQEFPESTSASHSGVRQSKRRLRTRCLAGLASGESSAALVEDFRASVKSDGRGSLATAPLRVDAMQAAEAGNAAAIRRAGEAELKQKDASGWLPLHSAAHFGHAEVVALLLERHPAAARATDINGWLPLHLASQAGHIQIAAALMDQYPEGAKDKSKSSWLPLHLAAQNGHSQVAALLVEKHSGGAAERNRYGHLPLQLAVEERHEEVASLLESFTPKKQDWSRRPSDSQDIKVQSGETE